MRFFSLCVAAALALTSTTAVAAATVAAASVDATAPRKIAVFPLQIQGLRDNEVAVVDDGIRAAIAAAGTATLQDKQETTDLVNGARALGVSCDEAKTACVVTFGKIVGVDAVVVGQAAFVAGDDDGGRVGVDLRLIDVATATEKHHVRILLPSDLDARRQETLRATGMLLRQEPTQAMFITVQTAGPAVFVDGIAQGQAPLAGPVGGIVVGTHHVRVTQKGMLDHDADVDVTAQAPLLLHVTLQEDPAAVRVERSTFEKVAPWVVTGAGAALAIGGAVAMGYGADPYNRYTAAERELHATTPAQKGYATFAQEQRTASDKAADEWIRYGQATVITGIVLTSVGVVAAGAGLAWAALGAEDPGEVPMGPTGASAQELR